MGLAILLFISQKGVSLHLLHTSETGRGTNKYHNLQAAHVDDRPMTRGDFETLYLITRNYPDLLLLTHLNADSSWLISFPRLWEDFKDKGRRYCHLLVNPWLSGTNIVDSIWIVSMTHAIAQTFTSVQDVQRLGSGIEQAAGELKSRDNGEPECVLVTHSGPDHCNEHALPQM